MIRTVALRMMRAARAVWSVVVAGWPGLRRRGDASDPAMDGLRRRYVFGALSRDGFENAKKRLVRGRRSKRAA